MLWMAILGAILLWYPVPCITDLSTKHRQDFCIIGRPDEAKEKAKMRESRKKLSRYGCEEFKNKPSCQISTDSVFSFPMFCPEKIDPKTAKQCCFQINPKPCWVDGQEGTCMFVYECIKSEGYHIGMCVDTFMFGSCCAHNLSENIAVSHVTQPKPHVLYSAPSHTTNKPVQSSMLVSNSGLSGKSKATSRPNSHIYVRNVTNSQWVTARPQLVAASLSVRPYSSSRQPTQPSRHSLRPLSTDTFSGLNSISLGYYTRKPTASTTEANFISSVVEKISVHPANNKGSSWTTEPGYITRVKKPTTYKVKLNKPTKKPMPSKSNTKYPTKPYKTATTEKRPIEVTKITIINNDIDNNLPTDVTTSIEDIFLESQKLNKDGCGLSQMSSHANTRIVGGKSASFGRWPWQVSVRRTSFFGFSSTHRCGGAVLNENWIATAGHCVDDLLTSQIRIRVGEYDFSSVQEELPFVERAVTRKVVHPKYNFFTYEYDLALVQLDKQLEFTSHIWPICLPTSDALLIGENATVTGWGRLSEGGTLPSILQEVHVPIVSNDRCKSMFLRAGRHEFIPDIFLCAGHDNGGMDSCQGDSGGPLQVKGEDGRYFLAGIISWGIGCAEANLPGVCTRISKFVPWIMKSVMTTT